MFAALAKLWTAFATLFGALNTMAASVDNLAKVGEMMTQTLLDEAEHDRKVAQLKQSKQLLLAE